MLGPQFLIRLGSPLKCLHVDDFSQDPIFLVVPCHVARIPPIVFFPVVFGEELLPVRIVFADYGALLSTAVGGLVVYGRVVDWTSLLDGVSILLTVFNQILFDSSLKLDWH